MKPTPQRPIPPLPASQPAGAPPTAPLGLEALRRDLLRLGALRPGGLRLGTLRLGGLRLPALQQISQRLSPWRLSLMAALLLHVLAASAWQLARSRQRPPAQLTAADDTPILLQFSREAPGDAVPLAIPLPPAIPLPLPPAAPSALQGRPGAADPQPRPAAQADAAPQARSPQPRSSGGKASAIPGRRPPSPAAAISPPDLNTGAPARQALERSLQEALGEASAGTARSDLPPPFGREAGGESRGEAGSEAPAARSGAAAAGAGAEGPASGAATADHQATAADWRLWGLARATPLPASSRDGLPRGLELRHLPLALARRSGASPVHRQIVRSEERLTLLWIDGPTLWLLRVPIPGGRGAG